MPTLRANGLDLEYDTFGKPADPPILLIMGLGGQMILWPEDFCRELAAGGYHVVRFDNRDIGLSTKLHDAGKPDLVRAGVAALLGLPVRAPYTLEHMAQDALGILDALKLASAHVVGASMGGMIAQILAARHPQRVRSLTLLMTTSGHRWLPQPSLKIRMRLVQRPAGSDRESMIRHTMQTYRLIGSPGYPQDEALLRAKVERSYDRSVYPPGLARQTAAIIASGSRTALLRRIAAPTLVIHGAQDPLVPVAAAHDLARRIPGAQLEIIPGMGHDLPPALLPRLSRLILAHAGAGARRPAAARAHGAHVLPPPQERAHVALVTTNWEPYIGESLLGKGYVYQLVETAFARAGYRAEIRFYPWARALAIAREGKADALMPEYFDAQRQGDFAYSDPFPGGPVGFCARRDRGIKLPPTLTDHPAEGLKALGSLRFGVVRGYLNAPPFDSADLRKDEARDDATNLRKLIHGRIDIAVIDRYVARYLLRTVLQAEAAQVECLDPPLAQQSLYVAFSARNPRQQELLQAFNRGLRSVMAAAELAEIMQRTGLPGGDAD